MTPKRGTLPGQSNAQAVGRAGERWFAAILPAAWILQRPTEDFGLDGTVLVANSEALTSLEFGVQIKTSGSWRYSNGHVEVRGINASTVNYWLSRLAPTMLVAFDTTSGKGYWGWAHRLTSHTGDTGTSKAETFRLPTSSELSAASWSTVRAELETLYNDLYERLHSGTIGKHVLNLLHELAQVLRLLRVAHASTRSTDVEAFRVDLSETVAYREAVLAISAFSDRTDGVLREQLTALLRTLRDELSASYHPVDMFFDKERRSAAVWAIEEGLPKHRPRIMALLLELMIGISRPPVPPDVGLTEGLFAHLWAHDSPAR